MSDLFPLEAANPFLTRVRIRNYKSIGLCDVRLQPLTFLVGQNGSGKSNFVDCLNFVREALDTTLGHALVLRGGIKAVRRISTGHPTHFSIRLDLNLGNGKHAVYAFRVGSVKGESFEVQNELCEINDAAEGNIARYEIQKGKMHSHTLLAVPAFSNDRLFLVTASGFPEFRGLYDALSSMGFYNPIPTKIRELSAADTGEKLRQDGENLASVFGKLDNPSKARIIEFLNKVVPDIDDVNKTSIAGQDALEFKQSMKGSLHPWRFFANSMSDGTLRALGILTALFHPPSKGADTRLVAIEEPETAVHPAAAAVLFDALQQAAAVRQILVTSHSPDLLDHDNLTPEMILAVEIAEGSTTITGIDQASIKAIREHLYTPGELLRLNQLSNNANEKFELENSNQSSLF